MCPCGNDDDGAGPCPGPDGRPLCDPLVHNMRVKFVFGAPPPAIVAVLDQAMAHRAQVLQDGPQAAAEARCVAPPTGCGQPLVRGLSGHFRDPRSRAEYEITRLCQSCQDAMEPPLDPDEVMAMALDTEHYGRCGECGEYRPYEFVDVGVGTIKGFDCCPAMHGRGERVPRCQRIPGCSFGADHQHGCETSAHYDGEGG